MAVTAQDNWKDLDHEVDAILERADDAVTECIILMSQKDFDGIVKGDPEQIMWYVSLCVSFVESIDADTDEHEKTLERLRSGAASFDVANFRLLKKILGRHGVTTDDNTMMELVHDFATSLHGSVMEYLLKGADSYDDVLKRLIAQRTMFVKAFRQHHHR